MKQKKLALILVFLVCTLVQCARDNGPCRPESRCSTGTCVVDVPGSPGCQAVVTEVPILGWVWGRSCERCNSSASLQQVSVSVQGNPTCPVTTTHSNTFRTPGCWIYVPFVGDRCSCFSNCYTTLTWTETSYVPAPAYGSCP